MFEKFSQVFSFREFRLKSTKKKWINAVINFQTLFTKEMDKGCCFFSLIFLEEEKNLNFHQEDIIIIAFNVCRILEEIFSYIISSFFCSFLNTFVFCLKINKKKKLKKNVLPFPHWKQQKKNTIKLKTKTKFIQIFMNQHKS